MSGSTSWSESADIPAPGLRARTDSGPVGLKIDEIHVWQVDTTRDIQHPSPLIAAEHRRSRRFHSPRDRRRYRSTRAALRHILANYLDLPADLIPIHEGDAGKPCLAAPAALQFNVSHSGDLALVAVSRLPVGIDLECMIPTLDWAVLAAAHCTPPEQAYIAGNGWNRALARFYRVWTRKEAYLKGIGVGLMTAPDLLNVLPERIDDWYLHDWPTPPGYAGALATPLPKPRWAVREFTWRAGHARPASSIDEYDNTTSQSGRTP